LCNLSQNSASKVYNDLLMNPTRTDKCFWYVCLIIGQSLQLISTFFWNENGRHSIDGPVLIILAMVFWAVGFIGLFDLFREKLPWYSRIGLPYAFYGCLGGAAFGFEGLYSAIFNVSDKIGVEAHGRFPLQMNLVLFWAGPAFPLTLLVLGILMVIKKIAPWWIGSLMSLGAIAFPLSRIMRIQNVAHLADVLLFAPLILLMLLVLKSRSHPEFSKQTAAP
jgi:hypothetical protein